MDHVAGADQLGGDGPRDLDLAQQQDLRDEVSDPRRVVAAPRECALSAGVDVHGGYDDVARGGRRVSGCQVRREVRVDDEQLNETRHPSHAPSRARKAETDMSGGRVATSDAQAIFAEPRASRSSSRRPLVRRRGRPASDI
jgi:hypothetical protein